MSHLFAEGDLTQVNADFWRKVSGKRLSKLFEELGPLPDADTTAVFHFHRFLRGASDDLAIRGWRYVMNQRQKLYRKAIKLTGSTNN